MSPVIRISDELFEELQKRAVPLVDNVEDVIWKLIGKPGNVVVSTRVRRGKVGLNQRFAVDILKVLRDMGPTTSASVLEELEKRVGNQLSADDRERETSGQIAWHHRVHATKFNLKGADLLEDVARGIWNITKGGLDQLKS